MYGLVVVGFVAAAESSLLGMVLVQVQARVRDSCCYLGLRSLVAVEALEVEGKSFAAAPLGILLSVGERSLGRPDHLV